MNLQLFEKLLNTTESLTLDFKRKEYPLLGDKNGDETAKFVKDITSFTNTIREESAYIILGVDASKFPYELVGIEPTIDEGIYQAKVKDKVYPVPKFSYLTFIYRDLTFGVIEIPIHKYPEPVTCRDKHKGIEPHQVYIRRGSTNELAYPREVIDISDWLRSLPSEPTSSTTEEISNILGLINDKENNFSMYLPRVLKLAKEIGNIRLEKLARYELNGWKSFQDNTFSPDHRSITVFISLIKIERANYYGDNKIAQLWKDLEKHEDYYEHNLIYGDSINEIENMLANYRLNGIEQFNSINMSGSELFPDSSLTKYTFYVYWNYYIINRLYSNIRQMFIKELTSLI